MTRETDMQAVSRGGRDNASTSGFTLSVVIVNFRTPDLTIRCIKSLLDLRIAQPNDIIVLDNMSEDGSADRIRSAGLGCRIIVSSRNAGFGDGVNQGVASARSDYVLCLNPDTYFLANQIAMVTRIFSERPDLGLLGLDLVSPDGTRQYSARRFYTLLDVVIRRTGLKKIPPFSTLNHRHLMMDSWTGDFFEADWVLGTGFVVRREAFDQIGGMDTDFFLYMEDTDLCLRLHEAGWLVGATPSVKLVHEHQRASARFAFSRATRSHLSSLLKFRRKHRLPLMKMPS